MDQQQTRDYVAKVNRRRRLWRRWRAPLAVLAVAAVVALPTVLEYAGCRYVVARERISLPTLEGLPVEQAREQLSSCLRLHVTSDGLSEDHEGAVVVWQHPSIATTGYDMVEDLSPIHVRLGLPTDIDSNR